MKGRARSDLRARPDLFAALCIHQRSHKRTCFAFKPEKFSSGHGGDGFLADWQTKKRRRTETANAIKDTFAASPPRACSVPSTLLASKDSSQNQYKAYQIQ